MWIFTGKLFIDILDLSTRTWELLRSYCACSVRKTRTRCRTRNPIGRSLMMAMMTTMMVVHSICEYGDRWSTIAIMITMILIQSLIQYLLESHGKKTLNSSINRKKTWLKDLVAHSYGAVLWVIRIVNDVRCKLNEKLRSIHKHIWWIV